MERQTPISFPRLYAAASLKLDRERPPDVPLARFPRLYAAASLKPPGTPRVMTMISFRFPRLYAAASLKPRRAVRRRGFLVVFSAALCRGLIEARIVALARAVDAMFSAALCRGLIEAVIRQGISLA